MSKKYDAVRLKYLEVGDVFQRLEELRFADVAIVYQCLEEGELEVETGEVCYFSPNEWVVKVTP